MRDCKCWFETVKVHPSPYPNNTATAPPPLFIITSGAADYSSPRLTNSKGQTKTERKSWRIFQDKCIAFTFKASVSQAACQRALNCLFLLKTQCSRAQLYKTNGAISPEVSNYSCVLYRGQKYVWLTSIEAYLKDQWCTDADRSNNNKCWSAFLHYHQEAFTTNVPAHAVWSSG